MEVVHFNQRQLAVRWDISEATCSAAYRFLQANVRWRLILGVTCGRRDPPQSGSAGQSCLPFKINDLPSDSKNRRGQLRVLAYLFVLLRVWGGGNLKSSSEGCGKLRNLVRWNDYYA